MLLGLMLTQSLAAAAPVGEPVPRVEAGRVALGVRTGAASQWLTAQGCAEGACDSVWRGSTTAGVARLTVVDGLALDAEVGRLSDRVSQASYTGKGLLWAAGARGALPLWMSGWWLCASGRYEAASATNGLEGSDLSASRYAIGSASGVLAWAPRGDVGFTTWIGGQGAWHWDQVLTPLGVGSDGEPVLEIVMDPGLPASAVLGLSIVSQPLGAPWSPAWRIGIELDASIGQSNLASGQVLVRF